MALPDLPKDALLFVPLGGSGEIGMNLNLYGCNGKWIMVDFGMTFAEPNLPGVELVFPDPAFIETLRDDLLGIVLTHGHEDHIGAVPYLWPDLEVPIYATPFTSGLVRSKLIEADLHDQAELIEVPLEGTVELGPFKITYVPLAHSIAEGNALVIDTPYGRVFHTGDWKLDDDPILGQPALPKDLKKLGDEGVLALIGDSTNVFNPETSGSEGRVRDELIPLLANRPGRVIVTTFASNAARLDTIGKVAVATGRKLIVVGRSLKRIVSVAMASGYLKDFPPVFDEEEAAKIPKNKQLIICTGCQGEGRAALSRIAHGEHKHVQLSPKDLVVFSSKVIPGNERSIGRIYNLLAIANVDVLTEKDAFIHVSGHPGQPDLKLMYEWIRPDVAIPVHGEMRHMKKHAELARSYGVKHSVVPFNGSVIQLAPGKACHIAEVAAARLLLDGDDIVAEDSASILERRRIAQNGYAFVHVVLDRKGRMVLEPTYAIKGVPGATDDELLEMLDEAVENVIGKGKPNSDSGAIGESIRIAVRRILRAYTGKNALTDVRVTKG